MQTLWAYSYSINAYFKLNPQTFDPHFQVSQRSKIQEKKIDLDLLDLVLILFPEHNTSEVALKSWNEMMKTVESKRQRLHSLTFMNQQHKTSPLTPGRFFFFSSLLLWTSEVWWVSCVLNHSLNLRSSECLKNSSFTHGDHRAKEEVIF